MSYESGNYQLKYYKELKDARNQWVRLEIYQRYEAGVTPVAPPAEIGDLQSMALEVQGSQGDVFQPIVKTSLRFSIVDTWDVPDELGPNQYPAVKHGYWEEFFTPDATLYLVRVKRSTNGTTWKTRWSGYITPDSWRESLDYHGVITITARDNIGRLDELPLDITPSDYSGMQEIQEFIEAAMQKINLPMTLQWNDTFDDNEGEWEYPAKGLEFEADAPLRGAFFLLKHFEGRTWYEALTAVLDSIGYTLRWCDYNTVVVAPIRNLPMYDNFCLDETDVAELVFFNGDRSLDPAYRSIEEELKYESEDHAIDIFRGLEFTGSRRGYNITGRSGDKGHDYQNGGASDGYGWKPGWGYLDGSDAEMTAELEEIDPSATSNCVILVANDSDLGYADAPVYKMPVVNTEGTLRIQFASPLIGEDRNEPVITDGKPLLGFAGNKDFDFGLEIKYTKGNTTRYWDGEKWDTTGAVTVQGDDPYNIGVPISGITIGNNGDLEIKIYNIVFTGTPGKEGIYARIKVIEFESTAIRLESNKVTTINNEAYNVRATRKPDIGPLSQGVSMIVPEQYSNALYWYHGGAYEPCPYNVRWDDGGSPIPLPAVIHMQMLCFHHVPKSILEGDCTLAEKQRPVMLDMIYTYKTRRYILQSCTYDFATCIMRGAILREFTFYDDLYSSTWTAVLTSVGSNKIAVIRALSEVLGISLRDAKAIADAAPTDIIEGASKQQCESVKAAVEAAGGSVTVYEE